VGLIFGEGCLICFVLGSSQTKRDQQAGQIVGGLSFTKASPPGLSLPSREAPGANSCPGRGAPTARRGFAARIGGSASGRRPRAFSG